MADVETAGNRPTALAEGSKAEDFTELAHREAFGGHHLLLKVQGKLWALGEPIASLSVQHGRGATTVVCGGQQPRYGWSISPERVVTIVGIGGQIRRIRWSGSIGIPGQLRLDWVVSMGRNTHRDAESVRRALEKQPAEQLHGEWAQFPRRFLETRATRTPVAVVERVDRLELRMHQRRLHER